jgi:hypothetical protein
VKTSTTSGCVISYIYDLPGVDGEVVDEMPRLYHQHIVPNINDPGAIDAQVRDERGDVPAGAYLEWVR